MWFSVGIDLGTSFSSAAVGGPGGTRMVPLSPSMVVPSVACPGPNGSVLTGLDALQAATDPASLARGFKRRLGDRSEEHTSELQSRENLVCRLLLDRK